MDQHQGSAVLSRMYFLVSCTSMTNEWRMQPVYVCACVIAIAVAFISDKTRQRGIYLAGFTLLGITGFSILRWNRDVNVRYMGVFFVAIGAFPGGPGFLSWGLNSESTSTSRLDMVIVC
jgi:hypothetical protein